ncbi:HpcH/HpaI aldolase family protein [Ralstonia flatus]|uniref:4-hydroxy-2-oxo-heptane-1,7-dioate aldolase n=1 Tax=Ralstonia flatus TaxID=3058601 RepID=A0AAD2BXG7_9RALS|nr:HpcH/HpaI aldolase/citrate lyase family protein [Ralstonia sp. LMG 32965]MBN6209250.1 HpcH/HpaI aldolase/citrate lyase family protein [Ralstonia pickettii]CAJ0857939.1 4-hydroxy-2-oxo-heptane-1,7-dioate aldolase [Ralstonia sp. LMG 32965]CAJ0861927.1 4-hydroxy-2-oxo-heptane-1,7-dioate aldolase [Ralstonia sp. LMG 32965]
MQRNRFKAQLLARKQQLGIWSMLASSNVVEVLTQSDYDWILLDTEHAPNEVPMVQDQLRTVAQTSMSAVVRPSTNDAVVLKRLLDIGAQTVLVPMVDTADDARRAVAAVRYPPAGIRGVSLATRANRYGRDTDYGQCANNEVCLLVQLETPRALENLEAIAAVEGIDGIFVGPADLAATMGHLGNVRHAAVQAAIHDACERAHRCGKPIGILMADPELNARYIADGFDYVAVVTDISLMRTGADAALKQARSHQR